MTQCKTSFEVELPGPEAADLALQAAKEGVATIQLLEYHVIRSAYGALHPLVIEFERRPRAGQVGTSGEGAVSQ
jgi:hypothetical protein